MHSFTVAAADPLVRRVNLAVGSVLRASISDYVLLSEGRSRQIASFVLHCPETDFDAFRAALRAQGCSIEQEDAPAVEVVEVVEVAPEPVEVVLVEEEEVDLSVLDLSVSKLEKALATGDHDDDLDELFAAEEAGKTRKSAVAALLARMELTDG